MTDRMKKILLLLVTLCGIAAAQITYTIPVGTTCHNIEGCTYHNLIATAPHGSLLYGFFEAGGYWTQFQYQNSPTQNPGYKAVYCNGTAAWTTATMDSNGDTFYVMDCQANADGTSNDPPTVIHVEIAAHSFTLKEPCGAKGGRHICTVTEWYVDDGTVTIGASSDIVHEPTK
jgi:hypothetical protein